MFILGIGLAIVSPTFFHVIPTLKLKAEAQNMAGVLRTARQEAITSGQVARVMFYPAVPKYISHGYYSGSSTYRINQGVRIVATPNFKKPANVATCSFYPTGAPDSGGCVTLENSNGQKLYVIVNPAAARIRVSKLPPENWN